MGILWIHVKCVQLILPLPSLGFCNNYGYLPIFFILIFASGGISSGSLCRTSKLRWIKITNSLGLNKSLSSRPLGACLKINKRTWKLIKSSSPHSVCVPLCLSLLTFTYFLFYSLLWLKSTSVKEDEENAQRLRARSGLPEDLNSVLASSSCNCGCRGPAAAILSWHLPCPHTHILNIS